MRVDYTPIDKIKPYPKNNRIHSQEQVDRIAKSISLFGFNQPIVIDENNEILVGHGRWMAAKQLDLEDVPCVQLAGLSSSKKRAYRILDNKLQNDSSWDAENLKLELTEIALDGFDLTFGGLEDLSHIFPQDEPDFPENEGPNLEPKLITCPQCNHKFDASRKDIKTN